MALTADEERTLFGPRTTSTRTEALPSRGGLTPDEDRALFGAPRPAAPVPDSGNLFDRGISAAARAVGYNEQVAPEQVDAAGLAAYQAEQQAAQQRITGRRTELGTDSNNLLMRGWSDLAAGAAGSVGSTAEYIGRKTGLKGLEKFGQGAQEEAAALTPSNATMLDDVAAGLGSVLTFAAPGTGISAAYLKGAQLLFNAGKIGAAAAAGAFNGAGAAAAGVMSVLEAAGVAQEAYDQGMAKHGNKDLAEDRAFWAGLSSLPIVYFGDKLGIFGDSKKVLPALLKSFASEGAQEASQQVASNVAGYSPAGEGAGYQGLIGGLAGGAVKGLQVAADRFTKGNREDDTDPTGKEVVLDPTRPLPPEDLFAAASGNPNVLASLMVKVSNLNDADKQALLTGMTEDGHGDLATQLLRASESANMQQTGEAIAQSMPLYVRQVDASVETYLQAKGAIQQAATVEQPQAVPSPVDNSVQAGTTEPLPQPVAPAPNSPDAVVDQQLTRLTAQQFPAQQQPDSQPAAPTVAGTETVPMSGQESAPIKNLTEPAKNLVGEERSAQLMEKLYGAMQSTLGAAVDRTSVTLAKPDAMHAKLAQAIKKAFGTDVLFVEVDPQGVRSASDPNVRLQGAGFLGASLRGEDAIVVNLRREGRQAKVSVRNTIGHELGHQLKTKHPEIWKTLAAAVKAHTASGAKLNLRNQLTNALGDEAAAAAQAEGKSAPSAVSAEELAATFENELPSEVVGELFDDAGFWKRVFTLSPNAGFARHIMDVVTKLVDRLTQAFTGTGYVRGIRDINAMRDAAAKAFTQWEAAEQAKAVSQAEPVTGNEEKKKAVAKKPVTKKAAAKLVTKTAAKTEAKAQTASTQPAETADLQRASDVQAALLKGEAVSEREMARHPSVSKPYAITKQIIAHAEKLAEQVLADMDHVAERVGGVVPPEAKRFAIKSLPRAFEKVMTDYKGDAYKLKDALRSTILVHDVNGALPDIMRRLKKRFDAVRLKRNSWAEKSRQDPTGYRDALIYAERDGMLVEIQVNTAPMFHAKDGGQTKEFGHYWYEVMRRIDTGAMSFGEAVRYANAVKESRKIYLPVAASSRNLASSMGTPSDMTVVYRNGRLTPLSQANDSGTPLAQKTDTGVPSAQSKNSVSALKNSGKGIATSDKEQPNGTTGTSQTTGSDERGQVEFARTKKWEGVPYGQSESRPIATRSEAHAAEAVKDRRRLGKCHVLVGQKLIEEGGTHVLAMANGHPGLPLKIWHSMLKGASGNVWEPIADRWYTPAIARDVVGYEPIIETQPDEYKKLIVKHRVWLDQTVLKPRGWEDNFLLSGNYDPDWSIHPELAATPVAFSRSTIQKIVDDVEYNPGPLVISEGSDEQQLPPVFRALGMDPKRSVAITPTTVRKVVSGKYGVRAGLSAQQLEGMGQQLAQPTAVFRSSADPNSLVFVTNERVGGFPMLTVVERNATLDFTVNRTSHKLPGHPVATAYGKDNASFKTWLADPKTPLLYLDAAQVAKLPEPGRSELLQATKGKRKFLKPADLLDFARPAEDNAEQAAWLQAQAKQAGYTDIDALAAKDIELFVKLAVQWREAHPAEADFARTDTPEFKAWFGDSKVVDAKGAPLVVYHGTSVDFDAFKERAKSMHFKMPGIYFTDDPRVAAAVADSDAYNRTFGQGAYSPLEADDPQALGQRVLPVYLSLQNPLRIDGHGKNIPLADVRRQLKEARGAFWRKSEFDGAIIRNWHGGTLVTEYVVFHPEQIKSAIGNRGTFDPKQSRIDFARLSTLNAQSTPKLNEPFLVLRKADRPGLAATNAGNIEGLAKFLVDTDGVDGPVPTTFIEDAPVHVYAVTAHKPFGKGDAVTGGRTITEKELGPSIGIDTGGSKGEIQHFYTFPRVNAGAYTAEPKGVITMPQLLAELQAIDPTDSDLASFDDAGYRAAGQALRNALDKMGVDFARPKDTVGWKYRLPGETRVQQAQRMLQNRFNRLDVVQKTVKKAGGQVTEAEDVVRAEERYHGAVAHKLERFTEKTAKPLLDAIRKSGIAPEDVAMLLYADSAAERNAWIAQINPLMPDGGSGMTNQQAARIQQIFRASPDYAQIKAFADRLRAITKQTQQVMLDAGLVTPQVVAGWNSRSPNYVPLKGFELIDELGERGTGTGTGFDVRGAESLRAKGRESRAGQIIENIILGHERAIVRAEKNKVAKALLNFVLANPDSQLWAVNKHEPMASFYKNGALNAHGLLDGEVRYSDRTVQRPDETIIAKHYGQEYAIWLKDKGMLDAMKAKGGVLNSDSKDVGALMRNWQNVNRFLSKMWTSLNPVFTTVNFMRDAVFGLSNASTYGAAYAGRVAKDIFPMMKGIWDVERKGKETGSAAQWYLQYQQDGGKAGFYMFGDMDERVRELQALMDAAHTQTSGRQAWYAAKQMVGRAEKVIMDYNAIVENAIRVSAYKAAVDSGLSRSEAASRAKNLTINFNRKGEMTPLLSSLYLFFNPGVQGTATMVNAFKRNPATYTAMMSSLVAMGILFGLLGAGDKDDEDVPYWDRIPDYEKQRSLVLMTGGGERVTVPLPYGAGYFVTLGYAIADLWRGRPLSAVALNQLSALGQHFSPLGSVEEPALAAVPTVLDPVFEQFANRRATGQPLMPDDSNMAGMPVPDSERYWGTTRGSPVQQFTTWLNEATGGTKSIPGAISVSPETLKNYSRYYTGGAGQFLLDAAQSAYTTQQIDWNTAKSKDMVPFLRQWYKHDSVRADMAFFSEAKKDALAALDEAKKYADSDRPEVLDRIERRNAVAALGHSVKAVDRGLRALRLQEIQIMEDKDTSVAEKEAARKEIEGRKMELLRSWNAKFYEADNASRQP